MEAMTQTATSGLTQLQEYGLAGIFLSFLLIGGVLAIRYFAMHCERRTEAALDAYQKEAEQSRAVVAKNTEAFQGVQIALVKLESKIDK